MSLSHRITVDLRIIEHDFENRHDKHRPVRKERLKDCIKCIRRLQNNPTDKDLYS